LYSTSGAAPKRLLVSVLIIVITTSVFELILYIKHLAD
jgi:hypothetical protein